MYVGIVCTFTTFQAQLRSKLIGELRGAGLNQVFQPELQYASEGSLLHRAANSLVVDHLRHCHYDYTLSIFMPESSMTQDKVIFHES